MEAPHPTADAVLRDGIVVGLLPSDEATKCRELLTAYLGNIPEKRIQRAPGTLPLEDYGAGSFGALNFSSSFHNPAAAEIDLVVKKCVGPIVEEVARTLGLKYVELIPDRIYYRTKPQPRESYHTDNTAGAQSTNEVYFGVIVNLSELNDRPFVCVPGTHQLSARLDGGDYTPEVDQGTWKTKEVTYSIPPNGFALVVENIVHRIASGRQKTASMGKFCGFRISNSAEQWCPENQQLMEEQAALFFKGGRLAPIVPRLWLVNWPQKCKAYCDTLIPEMRTTHTYKSGKKAGQTIAAPFQVPPSMRALKRPYPTSTEALTRFLPKSVAPRDEPPTKRRCMM